jgi:phosphoglycolate phosphatase
MKKKHAIIFDLDGTLLDTLDDIAGAVNRGIGAFGFPPRTLPEYRQFVGEGIEILVRRVLPAKFTDDDLFNKILQHVRYEYAAGVVIKTHPYPGIPEMLDKLTDLQVPMAILSNKPHALAEASVRALLSRWHFIACYGAREGRANKPDPGVSLELASLLGSFPEDVLFVGDSEIDILTAKNAGMKPVAVAWGFRSREELVRFSPYHIIDRPEELINLLSRPSS